jgi:F-box domain.
MSVSSESHNPLCNPLNQSQRVWGCVNLTRVNMNIVNLPEEVLVLILEYLSIRDKLNLQTACETFHQILKNNKKLIR